MNPCWKAKLPSARPTRRTQRGFTLFETIVVIGVLTIVASGLLSMQSKLWANQSVSRDQSGGQVLINGCAERLLAVRRSVGYASVTNSLCAGMGSTGGFPADPTVRLDIVGGSDQPICSTQTCTATISITNSAGTVAIRPLTLQFSNY